MSRSRKKTPGGYICATNHGIRKKEKRAYNRTWRRINKLLLQASHENMLFNKSKEIVDLWSLAQDGKYLNYNICKYKHKEVIEDKYYRK